MGNLGAWILFGLYVGGIGCFFFIPLQRLTLRNMLISALVAAALAGLAWEVFSRGGRLPFTW